MRAQRIFLSVGLLLSMLAAYGAETDDDGVIVCTYMTFGQDRAGKYKYRVSDIPFELCTHISYFGVLVDANDGEMLSIRTDYHQFSAYRLNFPRHSFIANVVVDHDVARSMQRESFRKTFTRELIKFMGRSPFDAVSIVFNELDKSAAANEPVDVAEILKDIRQAFQNAGKRYKIHVHISTESEVVEKYFSNKAICDAADFATIDTAGLRNTENNFVDVPAPLRKRPHDVANFTNYNVEDITQYFLDIGCAPEKLLLGVGLLGGLYKLGSASKTSVGSPSVGRLPWESFFRTPGAQAYVEFCRRIAEDEWTSGWDPIGAAPYIYSKKKWIGYENERSLEERVRFLKEKHLAGVNVLSIDMDDYIGQCGKKHALLSAIYKSMHQ